MGALALPRGLPLRRVQCPPLVIGLPVVWCPTLVVSGLVQQMYRVGYVPPKTRRPPWGLLDALVEPWGVKRMWQSSRFTVPCDCGRQPMRLWLRPDVTRWGCKRCLNLSLPLVTVHAARLLFALRLGIRGRHTTNLHLHLARQLMDRIAARRDQRLHLVQAATVVLSYDPRHGRVDAPGPVMHYLQGELVDAWLNTWASPVAYHHRCVHEILSLHS